MTQSTHASAALPENERYFRQFIQRSADAIIIIDAQGYISLVNPQAEQLFGYSQDEILGQPVEVLIPERLRDSHLRHTQAYTNHPTARPIGSGLDLWGCRRDRTEFPVAISLVPLNLGEAPVVVATITDSWRTSEILFSQMRFELSIETLGFSGSIEEFETQVLLRLVSCRRLIRHDKSGLSYRDDVPTFLSSA